MKRTLMNCAAVILTVASLSSASVFAAGTKKTAAQPASKTAAVKPAAAPAAPALTVPAITVSKYGEPVKGAFTVTWTGTGSYTYTLDRVACDKDGAVAGPFTAVAASSDAAKHFSAADAVEAGKYYKYRLSVSDGKATVNGALSPVESAAVAAEPAPAAPKAAAPAVKSTAKAAAKPAAKTTK